MSRRTLDILVSAGGLFLAVVLIVAGVLLTWAHNFVSDEVHTLWGSNTWPTTVALRRLVGIRL